MEKQRKTPKEQNKLIAQGNSLVEGKYNYSLWELRVFIEMVQIIERNDKEFKPIRIYINDLIKQYDSKSNDDYRKITLAAVRLMRKAVKIEYTTDDGEDRIYHSPLVIGVDTPKQINDGFEKYIELQFPEKIRPLLLDLKKNYLLYDKKNILNLKSKFAVRIYQILKRHERKDRDVVIVEYTVVDLRNMLLVDDDGNPTKQYKQYGQFEEKVILKAQAGLKAETDIAFSFDKIKKGRRVHSIKFYIRKNRKKQPKETNQLPGPTESAFDSNTPDLTDPIYQNEVFQKLVDVGVTNSIAMEFVKSYSTDLILYTIKKAHQENEKIKLTNFPGFVVKMIKKGDYQKELQDQHQKQEQKKKEAQSKATREETDRQIRELEKQFEKMKQEKVTEIVATLETKEQEKMVSYVREKFALFLKGKTKEEVLSSYFFGIGGADYLTETKRMSSKQNDFYEWMEATHKFKVRKNGDLFEGEWINGKSKKS